MGKHIVRAHLGTTQGHTLALVNRDAPCQSKWNLPSMSRHVVRAVELCKTSGKASLGHEMLRTVFKAHDGQLNIWLNEKILLGKFFFNHHGASAQTSLLLRQNLEFGLGIWTRVLAKTRDDASSTVVQAARHINIVAKHDLSSNLEPERGFDVCVTDGFLQFFLPLAIV